MKKILYIGNNLKHKNVNPSYIQVLGAMLESEGFELKYASSIKNKFFRLLDMVFKCLVNRKRTDIVLIDTYSTLNFYYAFIISQICRILKLKYIPILHGGNLDKRLKKSRLISKLIFENAKILVSPSVYMQKLFFQNGFKNVVHIPNAIPINKYPYNKPSFDKIKLLWVRSFSNIYNPLLAIKVLKKLLDNGYKTELCMVGPDVDGSLFKAKELAKNLNINVRFTGKLTKNEWTALSKNYNIFINTTNFDNMPISVIEAMALGLIVISTNVGGIPYLLENNKEGILIKPNDANIFFEAIKSVFYDPKKGEFLSQNARKKVEQFDWQILKSEWNKIL